MKSGRVISEKRYQSLLNYEANKIAPQKENFVDVQYMINIEENTINIKLCGTISGDNPQETIDKIVKHVEQAIRIDDVTKRANNYK